MPCLASPSAPRECPGSIPSDHFFDICRMSSCSHWTFNSCGSNCWLKGGPVTSMSINRCRTSGVTSSQVAVTIGGYLCTIISITRDRMVVQTPFDLPGGDVPVILTVQGQNVTAIYSAPRPTVMSVTPVETTGGPVIIQGVLLGQSAR